MKKFPVIDMRATGTRIKEIRSSQNFTVQEISEYMGFENPQAVYKWQRGEALPTVDNLFALSKLFDVPMEEIRIIKLYEGLPKFLRGKLEGLLIFNTEFLRVIREGLV